MKVKIYISSTFKTVSDMVRKMNAFMELDTIQVQEIHQSFHNGDLVISLFYVEIE